ncbi:MAG: ATP-binding cassette domain-containing protein [Longimicrobiales bacterium]
MPTLTLNELTVRRGPNPVVSDLSLEVVPGSVFWIVGPNGAGKSSLLRVLAGLDSPTAGSVVRGARHEPFHYFHSEMALPGWSMVGAWDRLVQRLDPRADAPTALRPELTGDRWIRRLSTGERKRLLLDALLRVPGSLLLDEPYEHLSPEAKSALSRLLRDRARIEVVVVVTNQATHRRPGEGGIRIEAGEAQPVVEAPDRRHARSTGQSAGLHTGEGAVP